MENEITRELIVKNSIRLSLAGFMFDGGDVLEIPRILKEMASNYEESIKKEE